jgi:hypothetical protein
MLKPLDAIIPTPNTIRSDHRADRLKSPYFHSALSRRYHRLPKHYA